MESEMAMGMELSTGSQLKGKGDTIADPQCLPTTLGFELL